MNKIKTEGYQGRDLTEDPRVLLNVWNLHEVEGLNLFYGDEDAIFAATIIDGPGRETTEASLNRFNPIYKTQASFNVKHLLPAGIEVRNIVKDTPLASWADHIKLMNHLLTYDEVTQVLDHMRVWQEVILAGVPRIILEAGAEVYKPIRGAMPQNSILSLANDFQVLQRNNNYICMRGAHAYIVDQYSAAALFNRVITAGIIEPLPLMFRMDHYCILPMNSVRAI